MQLCACCVDYATCRLSKRQEEELRIAEPCDLFQLAAGLTQDGYERIKRLVRQRSQAGDTDSEPRVELTIPFEVSPTDFLPPELLPAETYLDFVRTDFEDVGQREDFKKAHSRVCDLVFFGMDRPEHPYHGRLLEIQADLKKLVDAYTDDPEEFAAGRLRDSKSEDYPELLNRWLAKLRLGIRPYPKFPTREEDENYDQPRSEGDVIYWRTLSPEETQNVKRWFMRPELRPSPQAAGEFADSRLAMLFAQFAVVVLQEQQLRRCPVCGVVFPPRRRRRGGKTCGKDACRQAWHRNSKRYLKPM